MIENEQIKKLLNLSDEELRKKVSEAAIAAGADKYMTAHALSDMTKLRGMMSALTSEQISEMLSKIGPEKVNQISKQLNDR